MIPLTVVQNTDLNQWAPYINIIIIITTIIIITIAVGHAMICQRGGLVIQRHNETRDLQAELLDMVCYDVQVEPALQPITGEELARGTNQAPAARLDVHCRGFWERQRAAFFDIRVVIPMRTRVEILAPRKSTGFMEMKRSENTTLASQK